MIIKRQFTLESLRSSLFSYPLKPVKHRVGWGEEREGEGRGGKRRGEVEGGEGEQPALWEQYSSALGSRGRLCIWILNLSILTMVSQQKDRQSFTIEDCLRSELSERPVVTVLVISWWHVLWQMLSVCTNALIMCDWTYKLMKMK